MATDQEIRDRGFKYIPQQKYLQNPFELPVQGGGQDASTPSFGIPNTNAADNFSVYNPNPNSIVNKNYDPTRYTNLMEDSFLYGGSNSTDPRYSSEINNMGIKRAQSQYNLAASNNAMTPMTPERRAEIMRTRNDLIQDNRMNYGAQGQYETVPSEFAYSSQTELDKFKDNYPEYFGLNQSGPKKGIAGIMEKYLTNSFLGRGLNAAGNFVNDLLPTNRRSILENELGGKGILVNDIGQIVQGDGAYDTAGNVMAGYNANKLTAESFDKRIAMAKEKMSAENKGKRIAALEAAKADFLNAQGKADFIYDEEEENKKKKDTIISRLFKKKKEAETTAAENQTAADTTGTDTTTGVTTSDDRGGFNYDPNTTGTASSNQYGTYTQTVSPSLAATNRESRRGGNQNQGGGASYSSSASTGAKDGFGYGLADGGRVYFFDGGRVAVMNGGLISIL